MRRPRKLKFKFNSNGQVLCANHLKKWFWRSAFTCTELWNSFNFEYFFSIVAAGADLGFSREGGGYEGFQKKKFWFGQIDFPSSPKALKRRCFGQTFGAAGKFLKKRSKKPALGTFWNILTKKTRFFFWPELPLKVNIYWSQSRL